MEETTDQADKKQAAAAMYKKELFGQAGKVKRSAVVAGTTLLRQTTGFFKLPWSRLPAQGWLVLGIVFLMCAAGFALCLLQNTGWQGGA